MHILLTNDDGVHAEGILALAAALAEDHQVTVVAPDRERSAASHSLTLDRPLTVKTVEKEGLPCRMYAVNGTPVDCIRIGAGPLAQAPVDLVVAGINNGANLGTDISYSGTVHAAMEGAVCGYPSVAFSLRIAPGDQKHSRRGRFDSAARMAAAFVANLDGPLLAGTPVYNVNFPAADVPAGMKICVQGLSVYDTVFQQQNDPFGRTFYWVCAVKNESDYNAVHRTDVFWSDQGFITLTPLDWNATMRTEMAPLEEAAAARDLFAGRS